MDFGCVQEAGGGRQHPFQPRGPALASLLAFLILLASGTPQAQEKPKKTALPADLPAHVNDLARQLVGLHMDESGPVASEIQNLVLDHFRDWLARHPPSQSPQAIPYIVLVRRELEDVFRALRYPLYAYPAVFVQPWRDRLLIGIGYSLGWSDYDRANTVGLFEERGGRIQLDAATNFVPRTNLHYEFLPAHATQDLWLLIYGTRLGKSHPQLSAALYDFDGQSLHSLWQVADVYDGKLEVEKDRVVIRYMKESEFVQAAAYGRTPPQREAVYKITPQGLELQLDREVSLPPP